MKTPNFKSSSVLVNWSISYVSILLIPILISIAVYYATSGILEKEIADTNRQLLKQVKNAIDSRLADIEKIGMEILFNQNIKSLSSQGQDLEKIGNYNSVIRELGVYKISNSFIDNLYIYLREENCAISSSSYLPGKYFHYNLGSYKGIDERQWDEILMKRDVKGFKPLLSMNGSSMNNVVVYTKPMLVGNESVPSAMLLITMKNAKLLESISNIDWINETSILVIDKNDNVISANVDQGIAEAVKYGELTRDSGILHISKGAEKLTVSYTTSDITGWKYVSIIPTDVFKEKADFIKNLTLISVFLSVVIGFVLILVFVKANYNPMGKLVGLLASSSGLITDKKVNEFKFIQDSIERTIDEKERVERDLRKQNRIIRSSKIVDLLKGKIVYNQAVSEILGDYDIRFDSPHFFVMLISLNEDSGFFTKTDNMGMEPAEKQELAGFIVSNVVEELLCQSQYAVVAEIDKMVACIINLKEIEEDFLLQEYLSDIIRKLEEVVSEKFNIGLKVSISGFKNSFPDMYEAYVEALEAMEYKKVLDMDNSVIDIRIGAEKKEVLECQYYYPMQMEQKLINYIKIGDFQNSKKLLDEIYENNFLNSSPPLVVVKCLMFNLISTMFKTLNEIGGSCDKSFLEGLDPINKLMSCHTVFDMKKRLADILEEVCSYIELSRKNDNKQINNLTVKFVEENYKDPNLNISMIAEHVGITPAYLSKLFKEQTGMLLLDFINTLRIEKAKDLMKSRKFNIGSIASEVGFYNSNTFIRIFKKYEGVTPGKYKDYGY